MMKKTYIKPEFETSTLDFEEIMVKVSGYVDNEPIPGGGDEEPEADANKTLVWDALEDNL